MPTPRPTGPPTPMPTQTPTHAPTHTPTPAPTAHPTRHPAVSHKQNVFRLHIRGGFGAILGAAMGPNADNGFEHFRPTPQPTPRPTAPPTAPPTPAPTPQATFAAHFQSSGAKHLHGIWEQSLDQAVARQMGDDDEQP